jgi:hypothetical protein
LVHANQISYLRNLIDPSWDFGGDFGNMSTAIISMDYATTKELE